MRLYAFVRSVPTKAAILLVVMASSPFPPPSNRRAEAGLPGFWHGAVMHVVLDKRVAW